MRNRPLKKLGEIYSEIKIGGTPPREKKEYFGGGLPWVSIRDMGDNKYITETKETLSELGVKNSNVKLIKKGALLFSFKLTVGRMAFAGYDLYTNEAIACFEPNENIDLNYLYYILPYVAHQVDRTNNYGAPLLNKSVIASLKIPLPPLATQKAIVAKLDETFTHIDEAIATTQANIERTDELTKSVLDKVFEEGEWEKVKMGNEKILKIIDGDRGSNYPKKDEFLEDGYCLFLNTGNVRQGYFDLENKQFITKEKDGVLRKGKLELDDVILTTRGTIGNSAHYDNTIPYKNIRINSGMVLLRVNKEVLLPEYLLKFITAPFFHKQRLSMASGSAQPQLPIGTLNNILIPLLPLSKQKEVVAYLDQVFAQSSQLTSQYQAKLVELKELKASVLQGAFEGKLV